jgi:hypothetical protein
MIGKDEWLRNLVQVVIIGKVKKDPRTFNFGVCVVLETIYD